MSEHGPGWSEGQLVDQMAKPVFESALTGWAVPCTLAPDINIDYSVELLAKHPARATPSGDGDFLVQLKGETDARYVDDHLHFSLCTQKLQYYLTKKKRPVFLVVIDVNTNAGAYVFLQQYATEILRKGEWEHQDTVTIRIPLANSISNGVDFGDAARVADSWMTKLWPGTLDEAAAHEKSRIESLDPRLTATVDHSVSFVSRDGSPLSFTLTFAGHADQLQKVRTDIFEYGKEIRAQDYGIEITAIGFPAASPTQPVSALQMQRTDDVVVAVQARCGEKSCRSIDFHGTLAGGTRFRRLAASLPDKCCPIEGDIDVDSLLTKQFSLKMSLDVGCWSGKDCRYLPNFDTLHDLFGCFGTTATLLSLGVYVDGNRLFEASLPIDVTSDFAWFGQHLRVLKMMRRICARLNVSIVVPAEYTAKDAASINFADRFLNGDVIDVPFGASTLTFSGFRATYEKIFNEANASSKGRVEQFRESVECTFFGQKWDLGPGLVTADGATMRLDTLSDSTTPDETHDCDAAVTLTSVESFTLRRVSEAAF